MFKWGMSLEWKISRQLSPKKILIKLPVKFKKLIKEYLVQETEILNQLLGKWEKS